MIPANDFTRQWADTGAETLAAWEAVGQRGWFVLGEEVRGLEKSLAELWPIPHVVGVGSGLDALEISLRALGCREGTHVVTTPLTAFATTLAIVKLGAIPIYVDVDDYGLIDLDQCEQLFHDRPEVRFFLPVHLYGHALDMARLRQMRDRFNLQIVEDCAQSVLAEHSGIRTGTVGQLAAVSFYPTKNLGGTGEGGAVLTSGTHLAELVHCLRDYGQISKYQHAHTGYNSRLDELHAAVLSRVHIPRLAKWTQRRQKIACHYFSQIKQDQFYMPGAPGGSISNWHLFPVFVPVAKRPEFLNHMRHCGVGVAQHYPMLAFEQPAMQSVPHELVGDCANARRLCASEVSLPVHPYLQKEELEIIVRSCNTWKHN